MKSPGLYEEGSDDPRPLPFKWRICGHCEGSGKSSSYLGAYTASEWNEMDCDWQDDYMAGRFDRPCGDCDGSGKVKEVDFSKMSKADAKAYRAQERDDREYDAMVAAERRMGA
jgi:RecJ-like exonuclease